MKITKLGHSCVLVETEDRVGLFDPGGWSDRDLIDAIKHVDRIIYTHEHGDHFDIDILKSLIIKFPNVHVVSNKEIQKIIVDAGINVVLRDETKCIVKFLSPHEKLPFPGAVAPEQNGYHFKDIFTHPGDGQSFFETKRVLAMPFIGPWGKIEDSVNKVLELKPDYVLPIHDWHYRDEAKEWLQTKLNPILSEKGINLLPYENNHIIEIQ
jgi:L-ascorbate metabolism protein UlaG (beta-lactamase superfamily)